MIADEKVAVVDEFITQVLKRDRVGLIDELTVSVKEGVDWYALREYLASMREEYPGLQFRVNRLRRSTDGVDGWLRISVPISFRVIDGKVADFDLPDYLLPDPPTATPSLASIYEDQQPGMFLEHRIEELRAAIAELSVQIAGSVERYGQAKRALADVRAQENMWRRGSESAREVGDEARGAGLLARAESLSKVVETAELQLPALAALADQLVEYRRKAEAALVHFELKEAELAAKLRLAEAQRSIAAGVAALGSVDEVIGEMARRLRQAEERASEQLESARQAYEGRIDRLKSSREHTSTDVEGRLREMQEEIHVAATRIYASRRGTVEE